VTIRLQAREAGVENMPVMDTEQPHTQVFILRIWHEAQAPGECAVRIQTRHVLTGETRYFPAWAALTAYLSGKLDLSDRVPGA
jgi:hypothetical protein